MAKYAEIILPLPIGGSYTYEIPQALSSIICVGQMVEVPFGKRKLYGGIVYSLSDSVETTYKLKSILSIIHQKPLVSQINLNFWTWIANYYCCTLGEIFVAAIPNSLKWSSETVIYARVELEDVEMEIDDAAFLLLQALQIQEELTIGEIRSILDKVTVMPTIMRMQEKGLIGVREKISNKYKKRYTRVIEMGPDYLDENGLERALAEVQKFEKQEQALLAYLQLSRKKNQVHPKEVEILAGISSSAINTLVKKGICQIRRVEKSRLGTLSLDVNDAQMHVLEKQQIDAIASIKAQFEKKEVVLLHGVTGSGKTRVYFELMKEYLEKGRQILYLLPEINLSNQFIKRLRIAFGNAVMLYHSKLNDQKRAELFKRTAEDIKIIVGVRSSIFLPFHDLGLILVDESHDYSYKQQEPAPRYNTPDLAAVLGQLFNGKVLMGTATPKIEYYYKATDQQRFGYVRMAKRIKSYVEPKVELIPINDLLPSQIKEGFSPQLLKGMEEVISNGKQVLILRNRRGYAPVLKCGVCGWRQVCMHCDISMTYHKHKEKLNCHYCGYTKDIPEHCAECGSKKLQLSGTGTEKIQESFELLYPEWNVNRLDMDTASGRAKMEDIIERFELGETQVLVGTQMIAKGLDFKNVGLVGVLLADALFYFPDFRSDERAWQLLKQVAGRAGRSGQASRVMIQTYKPDYPVLQWIMKQDDQAYYTQMTNERSRFNYPPFMDLTEVIVRHKKLEHARSYAEVYAKALKTHTPFQILGPTPHYLVRIRNYYILQIVIKLPHGIKAKRLLHDQFQIISEKLQNQDIAKGIRMHVNVDPY